MLVVGHEIAVSRVAFCQSMEKCINAIVVASLLLAELIVVLLYELLDLLLVHLHQALALWVNLVDVIADRAKMKEN